MKTEKQKLSQMLLLLRILSRDGNILGNLKLQKQVFLNELALMHSDFGGLYYKYFRYHLGPFSAELAGDFLWIGEVGLAHKTTYKLTDRGQYLVEFVEGTIGGYKHNAQILKIVDKTTQKYESYDGQKLMRLVYQLEIEPEDMPGSELKVAQMPPFMDILLPECHEFKHQFEIPAPILEDIKAEIALTPEQEKKLNKKAPLLIAQSAKRLGDAILA